MDNFLDFMIYRSSIESNSDDEQDTTSFLDADDNPTENTDDYSQP